MTLLAARRASLGKPVAGVGPQFARPTADVFNQAWSLQGSGASAAARVGEAVLDDATFIQESSAVTDLIKFTLGAIVNPGVTTGHYIRCRAKSSAAATGTVSVELRSTGGGSTYKALTSVGSLTTSYVDYDVSLSSGEAAAIANYGALELWITGVSGGLNSVYVSQAWFGTS